MEELPDAESNPMLAKMASMLLESMAEHLRRTRADIAARRACGVITKLLEGDKVASEEFCEFFCDYVLRGDDGGRELRTLVVRYQPGQATHLNWSIAKLSHYLAQEHRQASDVHKIDAYFTEVEVGRLLNHFSDLGIHDGSRAAVEITATTENGEPVL